jgi:integrase/recombinase XerD
MLREKRITPRRKFKADPSLANPLRAHQAAFVEWTRAIGLAEQTACIRNAALNYFIRWCHSRGIEGLDRIDRETLEDYQGHLFHYRKSNGLPLAANTRVARLNPLRAFFKWSLRTRRLAVNPAAELIVPRVPRSLPSHVLTVGEVDRILAQPDLASLSGIRDRAILELLYSTGIRRMELARLDGRDVLMEKDSLFVRGGKGGRDRVIPVGHRACKWIERYLLEARERLASNALDNTLFLTDYGEPFRKNRLGDTVKRYLDRSGVRIRGACHAFRHACATHMLENGADIRFIQAMLGHSDLSSTQVYTRVCIDMLREVHAATHPAVCRRQSSTFPGFMRFRGSSVRLMDRMSSSSSALL